MRYMMFSGATYYPGGGWNDFKGFADSISEAQKLLDPSDDWAQVITVEEIPREVAFYTSGLYTPWQHIHAGWYQEGEPAFVAVKSGTRTEFYMDEQT